MKLKLASALAVAALMLAPQANATPEQDQLLFDAMSQAGVGLYPAAVPAAYEVCAQVWSGIDPDYVVSEVLGGNSGWSLDQARAFVALAIVIYCPPADMQSSANKKLYT